jgi:glycine reductase
MKLEMGKYRVRRVTFSSNSSNTRLEDGVLHVNYDELRSVALQSDSIEDVSIALAHPGERTRIVHVLDAIEPRVKVGASSLAFPGFLGPARTVGGGRTNVLEGLAVLESAQFPEPTGGILEFNEGFIDMSGPGAAYSSCSDTANVVLLFRPKPGVSNEEYDTSIREAGLRAAGYLAGVTLDSAPDDVKTYQLSPADPTLPRVAYIDQCQWQGFMVQTFLYGMPMRDMAPTLLHPNEMMDGAVVSGNYRSPMKVSTYIHCNNPVVKALYDRHGVDLNFVGVVLCRGHFDDHRGKERNAQYAAKLASLLQADGVVQTLEGTGNTFIDFMLTVQACENLGIKSVPIVHEHGGPDGADWPLVDFVPEARAIVSTGGVDRRFSVPAVERVIGGETVTFTTQEDWGDSIEAGAAMTLSAHEMYTGYWQMGISGLTARDF